MEERSEASGWVQYPLFETNYAGQPVGYSPDGQVLFSAPVAPTSRAVWVPKAELALCSTPEEKQALARKYDEGAAL